MSPRKTKARKWLSPERLVKITEPAGASKYYRLNWTKTDGTRGQTSGGRTLETAKAEAGAIEKRLLLGSTERSELPVSELLAHFLDPYRVRPRKEPWQEAHRALMESYVRRYFSKLATMRCIELTRHDFQRIVSLAPTPKEGNRLRIASSSLVAIGRIGGFFTDTQPLDISLVAWHGPNAQPAPRLEFIHENQRPTHEQVRALAEAAAARPGAKWWRALEVYMAAYTGVRLGELLALTIDDVKLELRDLHVERQVSEKGGYVHTKPPKSKKTRVTMWKRRPDESRPEFDLSELIAKRLVEAEAEFEAGKNPLRLLFPAARGGYQVPTTHNSRVFTPAAIAAGWPEKADYKPTPKGEPNPKRWVLTWHSLRHAYCSVALDEWGMSLLNVSTAAGHSSIIITATLYVNASKSQRERMRAETAEDDD